ncbi:grpb/dephospho-CoA kinase [Aspergillus cavernicola]|uniref:Grpb/dephospho-CoA kinase n=1 Tax=Aspergillus cavernicola TaxID=176166 RepID=A0ABR4I810_9EURO
MSTPNPITHHIPYNPANLETVSKRPHKRIEIVEPDPTWPTTFIIIEARIKAVLPKDKFLYIQHIGSTSVPDLPAKDVIDIDVVVPDPTAEESYVPALESAGFQFLHRERQWHEHRFLGCETPYANVHVFGPDSPEVVRHRLLRDWLSDPAHESDKELYASVKRQAARECREAGETVMEYNDRKEPVIREILRRVYKAHGLLGVDHE